MEATNFKLSTAAAKAALMLPTCTQAHKQQQPENSWSCYELLLLDITGCTPALYTAHGDQSIPALSLLLDVLVFTELICEAGL